MNTSLKVRQILSELTDHEYKNLFVNTSNDDEKLQLLTTESLLALMFITSIEDEFGICFDDDEIDVNFFMSVETVVSKINHALNQAV